MSRTFSKLREVTLTYNFPSTFSPHIYQARSISLIGRNLLYFAEKKDIDLEQYADWKSPGSSSIAITEEVRDKFELYVLTIKISIT
jgi:hypothetical protein